MKNNTEKITILKQLEKGTPITLINGEQAMFDKMNRKNFVYFIEGKGYFSTSVERFHSVGVDDVKSDELYMQSTLRKRATSEDISDKKEKLKRLTEGALIQLTNGSEVTFIKVDRTRFLFVENGTRYRGAIQLFERVIQESRSTSEKNKAKEKKEEGMELVKQADFGDILVTDEGDSYRFFKNLSKGRFVGLCMKADELYRVDVRSVVQLKKATSDDPFVTSMTERKKVVSKYQGQTIYTGYGPSEVVGLTPDLKHVELLEFGTEKYHLSFEDFLDEIKEHKL